MLAVAAMFTIFTGGPIFAQTGATAVKNSAPDPHAAEAQRRLVLSHRRRVQIQKNEQNNQTLMASQESPITEASAQRHHRVASMHRGRTPEGRRAAAPAPSTEIRQ